jgi:hypothetical protein
VRTSNGYLGDYSQLQPAKPDDKQVEVKSAPAGALAGVDSFYVEDIAWRSPRPKHVAAEPSRQTPVLNALRDHLSRELAKVRPVVDKPGPRTARVRAAVTDSVEADVIVNIIMTFIAVPVTNGGATIEAEVLAPGASGGGGAGRQIAAIDFARPGGVIDIVGFYVPSGHAQVACEKAAQRLREALEPPASN